PGGLGPLNWRRRAGKVANARGEDRNTNENQGAGDDPVEIGSRKRKRYGQQVIQGEAEQKRGEKEEGRSRNNARGFSVIHVLPSCVVTHGRSCKTLEATVKI